MTVSLRAMRPEDVAISKGIFRDAFRAFTKLPDKLLGEIDLVGYRYHRDPTAGIVAEQDGELLGACVSMDRGSISLIGPVMVRPSLVASTVGAKLLSASDELMTARGARLSLGFTFAFSIGHVEFSSGFGFKPQTLNVVQRWPAPMGATLPPGFVLYSEVPADERGALLDGCDAITHALFDGWAVRKDLEALRAHQLGETLILIEGSRVEGFACCHHGPGSEANGPGQLCIRLGAVRSGPKAAERFEALLTAAEAYAVRRGLRHVFAGMCTLRRSAHRHLLARRGSELVECGVGFQRGDDGFASHDHFIIDDWR